MALHLITINIVDPKDDTEAVRQLASAVVASAFNDYMVHRMQRYYAEQVRIIRDALYGAAISEGEVKEELLNRSIDLMQTSFFRRVKRMGRKIMRRGLEQNTVLECLSLLDEIADYEERRGFILAQIELDRIERFFHSDLYSLYTGNKVDLDKAIAKCEDEISKERERIK